MSAKQLILKKINRTAFKKSVKGEREIADLLQDIINTSAMSYKELAEICELSPQTVKRIAEGERPYSPNTETLKKVCKAFKFHLELN